MCLSFERLARETAGARRDPACLKYGRTYTVGSSNKWGEDESRTCRICNGPITLKQASETRKRYEYTSGRGRVVESTSIHLPEGSCL